MTEAECRAKQLAEGDVMTCEECGKTIPWNEYAVNFGWCDCCMDKHLKRDWLA